MKPDVMAVVTRPVPDRTGEAWSDLARRLTGTSAGGPVGDLRELHRRLAVRFRNGLRSLRDAPGATEFRLVGSQRKDKRAAVIEEARRLGLVAFDRDSYLIHRFDGFAGVTMSLDSFHPVDRPMQQQIEAAVNRLNATRPSLLVLERDSGDYAQAAGDGRKFVAEWRRYSGESFRHWAAGLSDGHRGREHRVEVPSSPGCVVTVAENEVLTTGDAKAILLAFARGQDPPAGYVWRDMTDQFTQR